MNISRPEQTWISWTTVSLNWSLKLHKSFESMVNKKGVSDSRFVDGTLGDIETLFNEMKKRVGVTYSELTKNWKYNSLLFYDNESEIKLRKPQSVVMETAFDNVYQSYLKHQNIWPNNTQETVEENDEPDSDLELSIHNVNFSWICMYMLCAASSNVLIHFHCAMFWDNNLKISNCWIWSRIFVYASECNEITSNFVE